jgi:hypothetical protein
VQSAMGPVVKIKGVKYGSDVCNITASSTKNVRVKLASIFLCVKTAMKPHKSMRERIGRIIGQSSSMAKMTICT